MQWKKSRTIYDGDWKDDRRCGFGTYSVREGTGFRKIYSGGWKNDKRHVCCYCIVKHNMMLPTIMTTIQYDDDDNNTNFNIRI